MPLVPLDPETAVATRFGVTLDQGMQVLAKLDRLTRIRPLTIELSNEGARLDQRPVVLQPPLLVPALSVQAIP